MPRPVTIPAAPVLRVSMASEGFSRTMIEVSVVLATPDRQQLVELQLVAGSTVWDAVIESLAQGLDVQDLVDQQQTRSEGDVATSERDGVESGATVHTLDQSRTVIGVYGQVVDHSTIVQDGDRVELYRPLVLDPMEQRRQRARSSRHQD